MTYTSQITTSVTAGYTLTGSAQGGFGPINATLGFQANASITITTSDSTTITIPNLYEGWNEYVVKRVKAVVGRTKYVGSM